MTVFYDPRDEQDLARVEELLKRKGIEYFLRSEPEKKLAPHQIHVAEEDLPAAEAALMEETSH